MVGKKPISFEWSFGGKEIKSNDEFSITNLEESSLFNIKSMSINKSTNEYQCLARNQFGFDKRNVFLNLNCKF